MAKRKVTVRGPNKIRVAEAARVPRTDLIRIGVRWARERAGEGPGSCLKINAARKLAQGINAICDGMEAEK